MDGYKKIEIKDFECKPFELLLKQWMLITAKKNDDSINTMTASWGGFGVLWNKPIAYVVIRPQRYTKEFVDASNAFSLCFFPESCKKDLGYLGRVSGREEDKLSKTALTSSFYNGIPYFKEAELVIFCRVSFEQQLTEASFLDKPLIDANYPEKDFHHLYLSEITEIFRK